DLPSFPTRRSSDLKVREVDSRYANLKFKYTGPWPPYNFVNIRLKLERAAEAEGARESSRPIAGRRGELRARQGRPGGRVGDERRGVFERGSAGGADAAGVGGDR